MPRLWFLPGSLVFVFFVSSPCFANPAYQQELIEKARILKLGESLQWRRFLMIDGRWFTFNTSMIDDPSFFLAENGKSHPEQELDATLKAFFSPAETKVGRAPYHPQCYFAARFQWLNQQLQFDFSKMPRQACKELKKFLQHTDYKAVSLIFSSYFLNNPASMFGHTLFRLHRERQGPNDPGLLDDAATFSAFVQVYNPITYPVQGLFGFFPGRFSLLPYYRKIQEYNNNESRDLWEYELNFTPAQVKKLTLILWELGNTYMDYYYLSDNCALILLSMLEAVDPKLELTNQFNLYATPSGTLKAVVENPGMVRKVSFRPSSHTRYLQKLKTLDREQTDFLVEIIEKRKLNFPEGCQGTCQTKVIDTAVEFIDFKERLAGSIASERYGGLRKELLQTRANLPSITTTTAPLYRPTQPDLGHKTGVFGLLGGALRTEGGNSKRNLAVFQWKPALHDLGARSIGYTNEMQIGFLDLAYGLEWNGKEKENDFYLKKLYLLDLLSLPQSYTLIGSWSWHFRTGWEAYRKCFDPTRRCHRYFLQMGFGKTLHLVPKQLMFFAILHLDVGFTGESQQDVHIGPFASLGALYEMGQWGKVTAWMDYVRHWARRNKDRQNFQAEMSFYLSQGWEYKLTYSNDLIGEEALTGFRWFF